MRTEPMNTEDRLSLIKLAGVWLAAFVSSMTLQHILMIVTIAYTLVQLYVLVRDKIIKPTRGDEHRD